MTLDLKDMQLEEATFEEFRRMENFWQSQNRLRRAVIARVRNYLTIEPHISQTVESAVYNENFWTILCSNRGDAVGRIENPIRAGIEELPYLMEQIVQHPKFRRFEIRTGKIWLQFQRDELDEAKNMAQESPRTSTFMRTLYNPNSGVGVHCGARIDFAKMNYEIVGYCAMVPGLDKEMFAIQQTGFLHLTALWTPS